MSAFLETYRDQCDDCYGAGTMTTNWEGKPLPNGPVICSECRGTGEKFTSLGRDLVDFLELWEKRKKSV